MRLTLTLFTAIFLFSCSSVHYVHPMYGNTAIYTALPLLADSTKTTLQVGGSYFGGGVNDNLKDKIKGGQLQLSFSHKLKQVQLYGGLNATLGSIKTDTLSYNNYLNKTKIDALSGSHPFSSLGINAGGCFVVPIGKGDEWRVIGLHASFQKDAGDYYEFRQKFDKGDVDNVVKRSFLATLGASTEFAFKMNNGSWGMKLQYTKMLGKDYSSKMSSETFFIEHDDNNRYSFFTGTLQYTFKKYTLFLQYTSGTRVIIGQLGLNYRIF